MASLVRKYLNIETIDGQSFRVDFEAIQLSKLLSAVEDDHDSVQLPEVRSETFIKVQEFLNHYLVEPMKNIEKVQDN